jgi:hypothetical protein
MAMPRNRERTTLMDRVALAFLSGGSALLLGGLLWAAISLTAAQIAPDWTPSLGWVVGFAAVMAVLGFFLLENFVGNWVSDFASGVIKLLRVIAP